MQKDYENALEGFIDLNKKILRLDELDELVYEGLFCSIPIPLLERFHLDWKCQKFEVSEGEL